MEVPLFNDLEILLDADSPPFFHSGGEYRTCNETEIFIKEIKSGVAIRLNNPLIRSYKPSGRSLYHLLHWVPTNEFFVSASKMHKKGLDGEAPAAILRSIMPVNQFCQARGPIETKHLIRAGKRARANGSLADYYAWRHDFLKQHDPAFYQELRRRKVEIFITYQDAGEQHQAKLGRPDVPLVFLEKEGVHNVVNHPDFWTWFYNSIKKRGEKFMRNMERATGIFLSIIDEAPISIRPPSLAAA